MPHPPRKPKPPESPQSPGQWVMHWSYSDGSSSGVVPLLFDDREKERVDTIFEHIPFSEDIEWVQVQPLTSHATES